MAKCAAFRATQPPDIIERLAARARAIWPLAGELKLYDAAVLALKDVGMTRRQFGYLLGVSPTRVNKRFQNAEQRLGLLIRGPRPPHAWMMHAWQPKPQPPPRAPTHPDFQEQIWTPMDQYEEIMGRRW